MITLNIEAQDAGQRLDQFLTSHYAGLSRAKLQKMVKEGAVILNGKPGKPSRSLNEGDRLEIDDRIEAAATENRVEELQPSPQVKFKIVHEDEDLLVIDKPSGLQVHPINLAGTETLANGLLARYPQIRSVGESPERPGIVHRLDREASGLMVVALNQPTYEALKSQFQQRTIEKEYMVLVTGRPPQDNGTIDLPIGRSTAGGRMAAHTEPQEDDRPAVTHYRTISHQNGSTLLAVKIETGRTHQIRVHFKALGCPVAGDKLYAPPRSPAHQLSPRLFLHATRLAFIHPKTEQRLEFLSQMPKQLEDALTKLKTGGNN